MCVYVFCLYLLKVVEIKELVEQIIKNMKKNKEGN